MPFSASTCLSGLGSATLGPTLTIYSNPITNLNPGVLVGYVATTQITGNACPYTFVVPDGTTTIRLYDPVTFCYADIPVSSTDVCSTCSLGFSAITNNLPSTINIGTLTGSCDNVIGNFSASWYGPNNSSTLAFTSGFGTMFPYTYTHPITNANSPLLAPGVYVSRITAVELNGVKFNYLPSAGTILSPLLTGCSTNVTVSPYNCSNGTGSPDPLYTHYKDFIYTGGTALPQGLSGAQFQLSAGTKAFAWKFEGLSIYDTLKLSFSGSAYPQPILLEQINIGGNAGSTNFTPSTWPKVYSGQSFKKLTVLTGLTVNNNDSIIIDITPHPTIIQTTWKYSFGCNTIHPIGKTCLDSYRNRPYKIQLSSITSSTADTCGNRTVSFSVSGCSVNDNLEYTTSKLLSYSNSTGSSGIVSTDNTSKLGTVTSDQLYNTRTTVNACGPSVGNVCQNTPGTIKVVKTATTQLEIYFTELNDVTQYYANWLSAKSLVLSSCGGTYIDNNTNWEYYKFITLGVYTSNGGTFVCGDTTPPPRTDFYFHYNSVVASGTTTHPGYNYQMTLTTPLITYNYACPPAPCSDCSRAVSQVNNTVNTRNVTNFTSIVTGIKLNNTFVDTNGIVGQTTSRLSSSREGWLSVNENYSHYTYPATGSGPYTLAPTLSGRTWDWENHFYVNGNGYKQILYNYEVRVTNFSPFTYEIWGYNISNFQTTGAAVLVYNSANNYYDPAFVYV